MPRLQMSSYARVLAFEKSIKACTDAGFHYSKIIAMQGPFSEQFNMSLIARAEDRLPRNKKQR